jgi:trans-aconitate 2-methyltransferase
MHDHMITDRRESWTIMEPDTSYLFGDSEAAAYRLELLARVFEASTAAFTSESLKGRGTGRLIDLGCGPGFTTRLLAEIVPRGQMVGIDASPHFLELARAASPGVEFIEHDVSAVPFPCGPADVIFCRFLLTHLERPHEAIARWASQLRPGGMILLEETAAIRTDVRVFARYLEIVEAMLASQSNQLYAGKLLNQLEWPAGLRRTASLPRLVNVRNRDAAEMFSLNLRNWRGSEFIRKNYPDEEIARIQQALEEIAASKSEAAAIEWEMAQVSLAKDDAPFG